MFAHVALGSVYRPKPKWRFPPRTTVITGLSVIAENTMMFITHVLGALKPHFKFVLVAFMFSNVMPCVIQAQAEGFTGAPFRGQRNDGFSRASKETINTFDQR